MVGPEQNHVDHDGLGHIPINFNITGSDPIAFHMLWG